MTQTNNPLHQGPLDTQNDLVPDPGAQEHWIRFISIALILVAVGLLIVSCFRVPTDADSFFHLATARNWFEHGLSPFIDHLTFTHPGEPVRNQPIVFQAMLYGYVQAFGFEPGYVVFKLTFMLLTVATVGWLAWQTRAPWPLLALAMTVLVFALQTRVQARPELGLFWFTALAMVLYHRTLEGPKPGVTAANMIPIAVLMVVWVAWYTAIFAYVIFFGLFLDLAIRQWKSRAPLNTWIHWFAWGLLVVALGWGPPDFNHDLLSTLTFDREWTQLIEEWAPPARFLDMPGTWVLALAGAAALLLCVRCRSIGLLVVLVVFIHQTLQISRLIAPTGIVIACSLLHLVALQGKTLAEQGQVTVESKWRSGFVMLCAALAVASSCYLTSIHLTWEDWRGSAWPKHLTQHLREEWTPGRIFHPMGRGGYLAYELGPEYQIYIDGRVNLLFSLEFFKQHLAVTRSGSALQEELIRYDVDYLLAPEDAGADAYLRDLEGWSLDFADVNDLLFVPENGRFHVSGLLRTAPECWTPEMAQVLREERDLAAAILPQESRLLPFIRHLLGYDEGGPQAREAMLDDLDVTEDWRSARFLAYRALDDGLDERVVGLLSEQPYWFFKDGLVLALAHLRSDRLTEANELFTRLLTGSWLQYDRADLAHLSALFAELERLDAVGTLDAQGVREFFTREGHWPPQNPVEAFQTSDLCYRNATPDS
jgi:hypothetical protein